MKTEDFVECVEELIPFDRISVIEKTSADVEYAMKEQQQNIYNMHSYMCKMAEKVNQYKEQNTELYNIVQCLSKKVTNLESQLATRA